MKWVTRQRPKVDRIACPWLIRRFIDPDAEIVYVAPDQVLAVAEALGANSFDAPGATFSHRKHPGGREWCTFETLIHEHDLQADAALMELARIVHAADIAADVESHPFGAALRAIGDAGSLVEADDLVLLERGSFVYDALYAYARQRIPA
ncbi:MAG: chromate resistance protein [Hamadaea sp.]|nr:chromate resistance protein [Hamadaea sp.]